MNKDSEEKIERVLAALENPASFTPQELKLLFSDEECVKEAKALLYGKEALARQNVVTPDVDAEWKKFSQRHNNKSLRPVMMGIVAAACIALFVLLLYPSDRNEGLQIFAATEVTNVVKREIINGKTVIKVPRGMQEEVTLPDNTEVCLNAESELSYDNSEFGNKNRIVTLKGEALFAVSKDSLRPFIVQADQLKTHVLGTVFNVRNYSPDRIQVTLLSGSLQVSSCRKNESLLIKPGEQAVLEKHQNLCANRALNAENITSWSTGNFYFDNQSLEEILCEFGRWYNVNVIFNDKKLMEKRLHFKASRKESLASIIELLNFVSKNALTLEDKTITVGK